MLELAQITPELTNFINNITETNNAIGIIVQGYQQDERRRLEDLLVGSVVHGQSQYTT